MQSIEREAANSVQAAIARPLSFEDFQIVVDVIGWVPPYATNGSDGWIRHPSSWLGVHQLVMSALNFVSVPAAAFISGIGLLSLSE